MRNELFYYKSAEDFKEALVLGNGRLGVTVYGGINEDVYALNDDTLWSGYPRDFNRDSRSAFHTLKEKLLANDVDTAEKMAYESLYGGWGQCYLPAGSLIISGNYDEVTDYKRTLSLDTAIHTVQLDGITREIFASNPDDVICIRYDSTVVLPPLTITLRSALRPRLYSENQTLFLEGEAPGDGIPCYYNFEHPHLYDGNPDNWMKTDYYRYSENPAEKGMRYGIGVRVQTNGVVAYTNDNIQIENASWLTVYLTIRTSFAGYQCHPYTEGAEYKNRIRDTLDRSVQESYITLKNRHLQDYQRLFKRLSFEIEGGREGLPTDERLTAHTEIPDPGLYALMYQYGRYLLIASSRPGTQAANLQGIWNVLLAPPWSCNYTTNINLQMNYWGACGANLAECCDPLHQLIYEAAEAGKRTAHELFDADGFCLNHNIDLWRITHPVGSWRPDGAAFAYFPLAGAWLTRHLYEYYLETDDMAFLNGNAYDAIMNSARFCDSMLTDYQDQLIFCPGVSPENWYLKDGKMHGLAPYSAMCQSIVRDAFEICIACCRITGRDLEYAAYLKERLERIPWLAIGTDGRILEWDTEQTECDPTHRHLSHLYSFYPAHKVHDPALLEACRKSLDVRGDESTGWSSAWKMCLWAILGDGNRALALGNRLIRYKDTSEEGFHGGTYPNLLCSCPPFQIDANFGILAAINEMMVQIQDEQIRLLPALPDLWKTGYVQGLRIHGHTIDIAWKDGQITYSSITPHGKIGSTENGAN